jgi:hypothetical protein
MCGGFSAISDENASGDNVDSLNEINEVYSDHLKYISEYEQKMFASKEIVEEEENIGILEFSS